MKTRKWIYLIVFVVVFMVISGYQYYQYGVESITWFRNIFYSFVAYWAVEYVIEKTI